MKLKSKRYNPKHFPLNSWNYRCLRLRRALGWKQGRLARVSGLSIIVIRALEEGKVLRPSILTIRKIKAIEKEYADILKQFDKAPTRMDRFRPHRDEERFRVRLLPIEIRRPEDIESLGKVETNSEPLFFGRGTRRKMQQTGLPMHTKIRIRERGKAIARAKAKKAAERGSQLQSNNKE